MPSLQPLFDPDEFRLARQRLAVVREVEQPALVLGSTQPLELVDRESLLAAGMDLSRRRGGGGAVTLGPGEQLWLDAWIPRADPLWTLDVSAAAEWCGAWWVLALARAGFESHELDVHRGRAEPGDLGDLACFAGRGPGEVFHRGRKVVGLSQWRAREGALLSSCAYVRWDPLPLLAGLDVGETVRRTLRTRLSSVAVGLVELDPSLADLAPLRTSLLESFPDFVLS